MSAFDKSFVDHLDVALDLEGAALESWLADLQRREPDLAQRVQRPDVGRGEEAVQGVRRVVAEH